MTTPVRLRQQFRSVVALALLVAMSVTTLDTALHALQPPTPAHGHPAPSGTDSSASPLCAPERTVHCELCHALRGLRLAAVIGTPVPPLPSPLSLTSDPAPRPACAPALQLPTRAPPTGHAPSLSPSLLHV